ncbi:hypothetical protein V9T40_012158 [Parthenolecanium corni]|uniref:BTB domain-containing protein n=1 Tax=Parthenolecanium corni TaxID=536013 RepID=A0AAN9T6P0_9HEMI
MQELKDLRYWPILNYLPTSLLKNVRLIYVLSNVGNNVILITNEDEFLFYGFSDLFYLGLKKHTTFNGIRHLYEIEALSKKRIKGFACSVHDLDTSSCHHARFVLLYSESGELYIWVHESPILIEKLPKTVIQVACGLNHTLVLLSDGKVYAWGSNFFGQYRDRRYSADESEPYKVFLTPVIEVSCGSNFSVVLSTSGIVYSGGRNDKGQLGINRTDDSVAFPNEVDCLRNTRIEKIACGCNHVLALSTNGELFTWGCNNYGQLGMGFAGNSKKIFPYKLDSSLRFKEIAALGNFSAAVTITGDVKVWGLIAEVANFSPISTPCRSINEAFSLFNNGKMYEPIEIASDRPNICETISNSFGNQESSDFKIVVEEKEIHVHKTILKLRSEYFRRMFQENWSEGDKNLVKMDGSYAATFGYLKYLYTDELDVDPKVILDVAVIADKHCEPNLVKFCRQKFEEGLNELNLAELYELTLQRQLMDFNEVCFDIAAQHLDVILTSEGYKNWTGDTCNLGNDILLATNDDEVLAFGFNSIRCHGTEDGCVSYDLKSLTKIEALSKKRIKGFACRADNPVAETMFVLSYLENGEVYLWGNNPADKLMFTTPTLIEKLPKTVTEVACGSVHVLALTSDGNVFGWGDNCFNQISALPEDIVVEPCKINHISECVTGIACGFHFSVVVTLDGIVYSWGRNKNGQLGIHKESKSDGVPQRVRFLQETCIKKIACGRNHVLALNAHGDVFSWGCNENYQLGCNAVRKRSYPLQIKDSSVELNENYEYMFSFIKFLYTDELEVDSTLALEVSVLADKYCVPNLVDLCLQKFQKGLDKCNVATLYERAWELKMSVSLNQ